jgi:uncharacterized protein (DUF1697 family)
MTIKVALLRSIVINGARVSGADARELAVRAGCEDVRSLLATGNLVFRSRKGARTLEGALEAACAERFGRATEIVVKTAQEWRDLLTLNPFVAEAKAQPARLLVFAMRTALSDAGLAQLRARVVPGEAVERVATGDFYCWFGAEPISGSKLVAGFRLSALGGVGTNRNWNTAQRLARALD